MSAKKLLPGVVLGSVVTTWATSAALVQRVIAFTGNPEDRHAKVRKPILDAQLLPTMFRNQFVIKSRLYSYDIEQPVVIHRTAIAKLKLQSDLRYPIEILKFKFGILCQCLSLVQQPSPGSRER